MDDHPRRTSSEVAGKVTRSALVSVIIPCFNQARFLPDCLASLQAQTYPHWEAIIINDGSTDETGAVARRYVDRDTRFKYLVQNNCGQAAARNRGLREASGAYIQFLDSDDVIAPEKFDLQIRALGSSDDSALAFCDFIYGAEGGVSQALRSDPLCKPRFQMDRPIEDIAARWETGISIPIHCFLFDARLFREHGICFDERLPNHEDWDCWMRIFALNPRIEHVPRALAIYRQYPGSVSRNLERMRRTFRTAVDAQLLLCGKDPVLRKILKRKRTEMDANYARRMRAERLRLVWSKSWVPSPIQRALGRLFGTDA